MQLWDDLRREDTNVFIVGATNRPQDLDPAILRRFERSLLVGPPDCAARKEVFGKLLQEVELDAAFDFDECARRTEGYTPSDIAAVCKAAAMPPEKTAGRRRTWKGSSSSGEEVMALPLRTEVL